MTKTWLSNQIKQCALELGFHAVGITTAAPFEEAEHVLMQRFQDGLLRGLPFDPETIRRYTHPADSFPDATSIVCVAISYLRDDVSTDQPPTDEPRGTVARFAQGIDYHVTLRQRLSALADVIRRLAGRNVQTRCWVDTDPIVDRAAAMRATVGVQGKNTCVYASEYGSWVVLGEIITDLDLEPDHYKAQTICTGCDTCRKACPTGAICQDFTLDVGLCLSQATQTKGFIPHPLRKQIGTRIYGCDTCQSACPLNQFAKAGNLEEFRPSKDLGIFPKLIPLLNISPSEFKQKIIPTTVGWIGRTRFRRNVAVALGNCGDPAAVTALAEAMLDPEPIIRAHAAWALGRIGTPESRRALNAAMARETDPQVALEINQALKGLA